MSVLCALLCLINALLVSSHVSFPFSDDVRVRASGSDMHIDITRQMAGRAAITVVQVLKAGHDKLYYYSGQSRQVVTQGLNEAIVKKSVPYLPRELVGHIGQFVPKSSPDFVYDWRWSKKNVIELYDSRDKTVGSVKLSPDQFVEKLKQGAIMFAKAGTGTDATDELQPHAVSLPCNSNFMQHIPEKEKTDVKTYSDGAMSMFKWRGLPGMQIKVNSGFGLMGFKPGTTRQITLMQDCVLVSQVKCDRKDRIVYFQFDSVAAGIQAEFHRLYALGQQHACPDDYLPDPFEAHKQTFVTGQKLQHLFSVNKLEAAVFEPKNVAAGMTEYDDMYAIDEEVDDALFRAYLDGYQQALDSSLLRRKHRN